MTEILKCKNTYLKYKQKLVLKDVSFSLKKGQSLGILGESGSGKTSLAKAISGVKTPYKGQVLLDKRPLYPIKNRKNIYRKIQIIYQDSQNSFDPKYPVGKSLVAIQRNLLGLSKDESVKNAYAILDKVGLNPDIVYKSKPFDLSGGECQRASIARALLARPQILVCDEILSNLDPSVGLDIINLLKEIREESDISIIFISHDYAITSNFCEKVIVLKNGEIIEKVKTNTSKLEIKNPYTKILFEID